MQAPTSDSDWPTVTVVSRPGDLEPRLADDAAVVGGAVFAALRPDRLAVAWFAYVLLRLLGLVGEALGIGSRMLPTDPVEAWARLEAGDPLVAGSGGFLDGLLHGVLIVSGVVVVVLAAATLIRMDAERLGRDRDVPLFSAGRWAVAAWNRLIGAVLLPPALVILLAAPAMLFGAGLGILGLDLLVSILWFVPLVFAFAGGLLLVAWLVSLPLIVPAATLESGDPVEVTVRVAGLLRHRLPRAVAMLFVALLAGIPGWLLVSGVAAATLALAGTTLGGEVTSASWPTLTWPETVGDSLSFGVVRAWHTLVVSIAHAWMLGFLVAASGRIFLVVRRAGDALPFDDLGEPAPR